MRIRPTLIALILSVLLNGLLAVGYVSARGSSARPGRVAVELGGVGDAQTYLTKYGQDHRQRQMNEAIMWLMWVSGILNGYAVKTDDGPASELSISIGNLAGALAKGEHVQAAMHLVRVLDTSIPVSRAPLIEEQQSQTAFDQTLELLLHKMNGPGWNPLPD